MATTRLADVIYGPLFLPTARAEIVAQSLLRTSGIAVADPMVQRFANGPGDIVQMPFWNPLTGPSNVSTDDPAQTATPKKLTQGQDMARKIRRNIGVQSADLVGSLIGEDPLTEVARQIGSYWVGEEQRIMISILNGIFAAASMAGNVLPAAHEDPAGSAGANAVTLDPDVAANAHALLGDRGGTLVAIAVHSRIFWNWVAAGSIEWRENPAAMGPNDPNFLIPYWQGKRVIYSDDLPRRAGTTSGYVYTSYLFANGSIGYAEATGDGGPQNPVGIERLEAAGNGEGIETVWYRRHWVMHPRGIAFTGTPASAAGVTDAELATAANWTRVYDPKLVRLVAVTTNG
ncbi:MAG TPA: hypothetical protein VGN97_12360 [Mesorhizobium sp.]|jgi:hypothetical protein|nr:hypothetical protein [Mesorhizobium sp.]